MGDRWGDLRGLLCAAMSIALVSGCAALGLESPEPARESLDRGDIALARQRPVEAEAAYREALALDPGNADARLGLARTYALAGRDEQALEGFAELAEQHPQRFAEIHDGEYCAVLLAAGRARLEHGEPRLGLSRASRGLEEGCPQPGFVTLSTDARGGLADLLRGRGELERAAELYREVAESDPARVGAWRAAGELLLSLGHRREALVLLSEALRHHPGDSGLKELMVDALAGAKVTSAEESSSTGNGR